MNAFDNNSNSLKRVTIGSVACDTVTTHDVSEEFTLPDYIPEVRRVLFTRAQILPESKYIADTQGGSSLDFGGTVTYSVIYTDDEGRLCSVPLSSNYESSVMLKGHPCTVFIDTSPDNVTTRVNAPRKLTVKARLKSRVFGFEDQEVAEIINQKSSADELFIERQSEDVRTVSVASGSLNNIRMSEKFDTGSRKELRPVLCDASAYLKEVKATNGGVSCHGEVTVKCICECEGELVTLSRALPLYEEIEVEGAIVGDMARASARCISLSISSEEKDDGCELFFDICCEIDAEVYRNEENTLTKDCYSTKNDITIEYKDMELYSLVRSWSGSYSLNESIKRKNKDGAEIVDALVDPVYEKCDIKGERATIIGRLCTTLICKNEKDDGTYEYSSESYEVPIKYECELGVKCENPIVRASLACSCASAKFSDDKLHISADIYPSACVLDKCTTTILGSATLRHDVEFKKDASCVRVFFPKDSDVLWEVAKKYHTTQKKIMEQNALNDLSLKGVKSIII